MSRTNRNLRQIFILAASLCVVTVASQEPDAAGRVLDPVRQRAVWDAEHTTFKIEWRFGEWFLDGMRERDAELLLEAFHKRFSGAVIGGQALEESREKIGVVESQRSGGAAEAGAAGIVASLLNQLQALEEIDTLGMRVLQIAAAGDGRWDSRLLLTASGTGAGGSVVALDSHHAVQFQVRSNTDFGGGAVVSSWEVLSERRRVAPRMFMQEVTEASQLHRVPLADNWKMDKQQVPLRYGFQFAVEDFDRDGFLDIALASVRGPTALLKSIGGRQFAVANQALGIPRMSNRADRSLACWLDFDNDGFPDLILGDRVYHNLAGERFEEVTAESGLEFPQSPMGCAVADYDGDGFCDLYVLYQGGGGLGEALPWVGDDISGSPNTLWRSLGDGRFEDVTEASKSGAGKRNSFAGTWLYADADALPDLYVANDFGANNLLRNRGDGSFDELAGVSGAADFATSMGVASGDLDNDGLPEIYVANMYSKMGRRIISQVTHDDYEPGVYSQIQGACAGNRLYRRGSETERFREWSEAWGINDIGWAYAPAITDLDNDGLLDIYATTGFLSFERREPDG